MPKQIIITGPSGSGKTSIMEMLVKDYPDKYKRPIQFTTREPRDDSELDIYVFLTKEQFMKKLEKGDFMEFTEYNGHFYAISRYFDDSMVNVFIVEPVGRAALKKYFHANAIPYTGYYLELPVEIAKERMINRGDYVASIERRLKDYDYFCPELDDKILDATLSIKKNVVYINNHQV